MLAMPILTERENEIMECVLNGMSNKEIALQLSVALRTVEQHLTNIYHKLGVTSRAAAIILLLRRLPAQQLLIDRSDWRVLNEE